MEFPTGTEEGLHKGGQPFLEAHYLKMKGVRLLKVGTHSRERNAVASLAVKKGDEAWLS